MARPLTVRRVILQALLWAGPASILLAVVVLVASIPYFRHGPGVPTAGDDRAWNAIWSALGLVSLGCIVGLVANVAWLVTTLRARRPTTGEWLRTATGLVLGVTFFKIWFGAW